MAMREFLDLGGPGDGSPDPNNDVAGDSDNDGGSEYVDHESSDYDDGDVRYDDD